MDKPWKLLEKFYYTNEGGDHCLDIQMEKMAFDVIFPPAYGKDESIKTARSIAAVPELLAAARDALSYLVELDLCRADESPASALRAAIEKAEGDGDGKV